MTVASMLWRRLDAPGHDACRLEQTGDGWQLDGTAVFRQNGVPAHLAYGVTCDAAWHARRGHVRGWIGSQPVTYTIVRAGDGGWILNDGRVRGLNACLDLDLGFTPATNLLQLRRLGLAEGQSADTPVAWLDVESAMLDVLRQRYERRGTTSYWYEAPRFGYAALLDVASTGFIRHYPGLWEAEL
jgi:hypothetical protein